MDSMVVGGVTFACTFGGALLGMWLRTVLPEAHISGDSKDVMKLGTGLLATISALVLGLLIASAKSSFDAQRVGFQQITTNMILLDRSLANYGPEAKEARELLRTNVATMITYLWPESGAATLAAPEIMHRGSMLIRAVRALKPKNDEQRSIHTQALQFCVDLGRNYWMLRQGEESTIPRPFLAVLIFWLAVLFTSFGLFASHNATVLIVLLVCALSVAGALFLIVDFDQPFDGLIQISSGPLQSALGQLGH